MLNLVPLVIFYCISSAILFWFDAAFCLFCVFFPSGFVGPGGNFDEFVLFCFPEKSVIIFLDGLGFGCLSCRFIVKWRIWLMKDGRLFV